MPIPGSPTSTNAAPEPARADASAPARIEDSAARPTSTDSSCVTRRRKPRDLPGAKGASGPTFEVRVLAARLAHEGAALARARRPRRKGPTMRTRTRIMLAGLALGAALAGGVAWATTTSEGAIHGCLRGTKSGAFALVDGADACKKNELAISWNKKGVKGEPGRSRSARRRRRRRQGRAPRRRRPGRSQGRDRRSGRRRQGRRQGRTGRAGASGASRARRARPARKGLLGRPAAARHPSRA